MDLESNDADISALRSHLTSYLYGMRTLDERALAVIASSLEPYMRAPHPPRTRLKAAKVRDLFMAFYAQRPVDRRFDQRTVWKLKVAILQLCAAALQLDKGAEAMLRGRLRLVARDGARVALEP